MGPIGVGAVAGLARVATGAWVRGAAWGVGAGLKASQRLAAAAVSPEAAARLADDVRDETVRGLRTLLGFVESEPRTAPLGDAFSAIVPDERAPSDPERDRAESLRSRGGALLERAAAIDRDGMIHPGFEQIIDQLAPDEGRILKLLINDGAQPIVYVNRAAPMGLGAREVARRLTLAGREAGVQRPELVAAYLDNLVRLGLIAIRRDPVAGDHAYEVLEAQPEVTEAIKSVGGTVFRGQLTRRSVHLTDFGRAFCQVCFPPEHLTGEHEAIELAPEQVAAPPERDLDEAAELDA